MTASCEAATKSIFFSSEVTGAGDEIGWDFISRVQTSRISFTGFCREMTRIYETSHPLSGPFMSPNTFISWFFGWLSAFKLDFRKEIDEWCGYSPKVLACDGTHIGVSVQYQNLEDHVTKVDQPTVIKKPIHQR